MALKIKGETPTPTEKILELSLSKTTTGVRVYTSDGYYLGEFVENVGFRPARGLPTTGFCGLSDLTGVLKIGPPN